MSRMSFPGLDGMAVAIVDNESHYRCSLPVLAPSEHAMSFSALKYRRLANSTLRMRVVTGVAVLASSNDDGNVGTCHLQHYSYLPDH